MEFHSANIKVVSIGNGGDNVVNRLIESHIEGIECIAINTDMQSLTASKADVKIQIGKQLTHGLGAGTNPSIAHDAAVEDHEKVRQALHGSDLVFLIAGMGGGTGTGAAPVVAEAARSLGALVVAIVTRPFEWEGTRRKEQADVGIYELRQFVDTLIVIPSHMLFSIIDEQIKYSDMFQKVDNVLYNAIRGIAKLITGHGVVNIDFADVRTVMQNMGDALMGIGTATGEHRATEAAQNAINSPLLDGVPISGSEVVLINISASSDMTMMEVDEALKMVHDAVGTDANIIFGVVLDDDLADAMMVSVIAGGGGFSRAIGLAEETDQPRMGYVQQEVSSPTLIVAWDPSVVEPKVYAEIIEILGELTRLEGGKGVSRVGSHGIEVPALKEEIL